MENQNNNLQELEGLRQQVASHDFSIVSADRRNRV